MLVKVIRDTGFDRQILKVNLQELSEDERSKITLVSDYNARIKQKLLENDLAAVRAILEENHQRIEEFRKAQAELRKQLIPED